jgi:hypothetical protein
MLVDRAPLMPETESLALPFREAKHVPIARFRVLPLIVLAAVRPGVLRLRVYAMDALKHFKPARRVVVVVVAGDLATLHCEDVRVRGVELIAVLEARDQTTGCDHVVA